MMEASSTDFGHTAADSAALMVLLMDDSEAVSLMSRLDPEELRILGESMCDLGDVAPPEVASALAEFARQADQTGLEAHGRAKRVRAMMSNAVGEIRADSVMRRIQPDDIHHRAGLELVKWLEPEVILPMIVDEYPQTIAALLVLLDPRIAAMILAGLPDELQPDVVHRIATLGPVGPAAIEMLEQLLESRIAERFGALPMQLGGLREAAELMNQSARAVEQRVMPAISKRDKDLAKAMENEMFKFEHLYTLDPQMMGQLLREVDSEILIDALKGIEPPQREAFYAAMSTRAADGVKDEIEARGRLKAAVANQAQARVVAVARRQSAEGLIVFGNGGDADYV